jgi:Peptidase S24-like
MNFQTLQENLRVKLWERIKMGQITGSSLAEQAGFKQAHVSNFLYRKRGLSVKGLDRLLEAQHLSVLDLLDPVEISKHALILPSSDREFDNVVVTELSIAATEAQIMNMHVKEVLKVPRSFLQEIKEEPESTRRTWERFVAVRADGQDAMSMYPRLRPGATVLLDRHYNSPSPYRAGERNIYAIHTKHASTIRYVEISGSIMLLRPHNRSVPVQVVPMNAGMTPADYIVGRVCHVGSEA